jgi:hypothetical protein
LARGRREGESDAAVCVGHVEGQQRDEGQIHRAQADERVVAERDGLQTPQGSPTSKTWENK